MKEHPIAPVGIPTRLCGRFFRRDTEVSAIRAIKKFNYRNPDSESVG